MLVALGASRVSSINSRATTMKAPFLLVALGAGTLVVTAQTTSLLIGECDDLPSSITNDTTLEFTAQEV